MWSVVAELEDNLHAVLQKRHPAASAPVPKEPSHTLQRRRTPNAKRSNDWCGGITPWSGSSDDSDDNEYNGAKCTLAVAAPMRVPARPASGSRQGRAKAIEPTPATQETASAPPPSKACALIRAERKLSMGLPSKHEGARHGEKTGGVQSDSTFSGATLSGATLTTTATVRKRVERKPWHDFYSEQAAAVRKERLSLLVAAQVAANKAAREAAPRAARACADGIDAPLVPPAPVPTRTVTPEPSMQAMASSGNSSGSSGGSTHHGHTAASMHAQAPHSQEPACLMLPTPVWPSKRGTAPVVAAPGGAGGTSGGSGTPSNVRGAYASAYAALRHQRERLRQASPAPASLTASLATTAATAGAPTAASAAGMAAGCAAGYGVAAGSTTDAQAAMPSTQLAAPAGPAALAQPAARDAPVQPMRPCWLSAEPSQQPPSPGVGILGASPVSHPAPCSSRTQLLAKCFTAGAPPRTSPRAGPCADDAGGGPSAGGKVEGGGRESAEVSSQRVSQKPQSAWRTGTGTQSGSYVSRPPRLRDVLFDSQHDAHAGASIAKGHNSPSPCGSYDSPVTSEPYPPHLLTPCPPGEGKATAQRLSPRSLQQLRACVGLPGGACAADRQVLIRPSGASPASPSPSPSPSPSTNLSTTLIRPAGACRSERACTLGAGGGTEPSSRLARGHHQRAPASEHTATAAASCGASKLPCAPGRLCAPGPMVEASAPASPPAASRDTARSRVNMLPPPTPPSKQPPSALLPGAAPTPQPAGAVPSALPSTPDVPYRCALDVPGQPPAAPLAQQKAPPSLAEWSLKPSRAAPVVPRIQAERSPQTKAARSQRQQQHVEPRRQQQWSHHVDPRPSPSLAVTATSSLHPSFISPFQVPTSSSEPHIEPKTRGSTLAQGVGHRQHHQKTNGRARAGGEGREVATADAVLVQHDRRREPSRGPAERLPTPAARPTSTSLHGSFPMKL